MKLEIKNINEKITDLNKWSTIDLFPRAHYISELKISNNITNLMVSEFWFKRLTIFQR
jgi:hypothetical protein